MTRIVVVGNGMVGARFVEDLMKADAALEYRVTVIGDEAAQVRDGLFHGVQPVRFPGAAGGDDQQRGIPGAGGAQHIGAEAVAIIDFPAELPGLGDLVGLGVDELSVSVPSIIWFI